jgi:nicotinate-nucleotide--dimethylbenzimidazole phosphoribosyltransferase
MILKPEIAIFASSQGVENGINADMPAILEKNINSLKAGKHQINQACNVAGCGLKTYDLNIQIPTDDIRYEAAMTEVEATQIIAYSMEAVRDADILVITELGCCEKISAQAIIKALYNSEIPQDFHFSTAVSEALALHDTNHAPLEILRRLGSREIAAMVGVIIAARYQNVPVILDGLSAVAAACIVAHINSDAIKHCLVGNAYPDPIFDFALEQLHLEPIVSLGIKHDAGIGSTVAINIIKTALAIHNYTDR